MAAQNQTVRMSLPSFLGGNNPANLLGMMGLTGSQASDGTWSVRRSPAQLVKCLTLAAPWLGEQKFDLLDAYGGQQDDYPHSEVLFNLVENQLESRRAAGDLTAWLYGIQTAIFTAPNAQVVARTQDAHATISAFGDNGKPAFPGHSTHAVIFGPGLYARAKLPQLLIGFEQDPRLSADIASSDVNGPITPEQLPIGKMWDSSSAILQSSLTLGTNYIAPLLGCCSPHVWAIHGQRVFMALLFSLGRATLGTDTTRAELLQLLPYAFSVVEPPTAAPALDKKSCAEAIDWWGLKLQQMFDYLSDPTYFADSDGNYSPYQHQNWMMTVDQVFQRIGSIATSHRDWYAQLIMMFGALDAIGDRIRGVGSQALYVPTRAKEALKKVKASIPAPAAKLLLPQAERAVDALARVPDGFFIRKRLGTTNVSLVNSAGNIENWDIEHSTKKLLRGRRNATHGFGSHIGHDDDNARILAHHNGELPIDLVHLGYLYLLEMLCTPEEIISTIRSENAN